MSKIAYVIAALAAVGICFVVATSNPSEPTASDVANVSTVSSEAGTLTLDVPDMHCSVACYPKVKKSLEQSEAIENVELAEQPDDGPFNPQVIVHYEPGFEVTQATAALAGIGYPATVAE